MNLDLFLSPTSLVLIATPVLGFFGWLFLETEDDGDPLFYFGAFSAFLALLGVLYLIVRFVRFVWSQ